jgi:hypothetical protein
VRISRFGKIEELHGKELARFYTGDDERRAMFKRLGEQYVTKLRKAQR